MHAGVSAQAAQRCVDLGVLAVIEFVVASNVQHVHPSTRAVLEKSLQQRHFAFLASSLVREWRTDVAGEK
jgi:hypothetical protein